MNITKEEAEKVVAEAIQKGCEFYKNGHNDVAEAIFKQTLCVDPDHVVALQMLGLIESRKPGMIEEAMKKLYRAKELDPANADVHNNLALVYSWSDQKDMEKATEHYEKALELNPKAVHFYSNLGIHYKMLGQIDRAEKVLLDGIAVDPTSTMLYFNYGTLLGEQKRWGEAVACYKKAIELKPDFAAAHYNLSTVYLTLGDLKLGWEEYEWRWESYPEFKKIYTRFPDEKRWDGKVDPAGKRFFLYAEQGMGDTIQFARFVKVLKNRGAAHITLEEHPDLVKLMRTLAGADRVTSYADPVPEFDLHCSVVSLPYLLGFNDLNSIPNEPYLRCNYPDLPDLSILDDKHWRSYEGKLRVGIAWGGNPVHRHDPWRSTDLKNFRRLQLDSVKLFSLQKDTRPRFWPGFGQRDLCAGSEGMSVVDLKEFMVDYNATAALLDRMDLVITVDTATAHLASAMGKSVWLLVAYHNDWRWLANGMFTNWYPNMRIFRQPAHGDWESVFVELEKALSLKCG